MDTTNTIYHDNPSAIYTLLKAARNRNNTFAPGREYPAVSVTRHGFTVNQAHLRAFNEICDIRPGDHLHILYPFALAYPYIMRVLCARGMPISLFKVLNTRNSITLRRKISPDERLEIECRNTAPRTVAKGLELDIISTVSPGGACAWENTSTYFIPGNFGPADASFSAPRPEPAKAGRETIQEWFFPARDRFRFARISGDTNGIHYGSLYARLMGFKRDFAQPIRVVAKCVSSLPEVVPDRPARLDFHLKGPVYYENTLVLKNVRTGSVNRFDLYCGGNDRPVICGSMQTL